jgi:hypothetical protein
MCSVSFDLPYSTESMGIHHRSIHPQKTLSLNVFTHDYHSISWRKPQCPSPARSFIWHCVNHLEILDVGEEDSASNICRKKGIGGGDGYAVKPDG